MSLSLQGGHRGNLPHYSGFGDGGIQRVGVGMQVIGLCCMQV